MYRTLIRMQQNGCVAVYEKPKMNLTRHFVKLNDCTMTSGSCVLDVSWPEGFQ